MLNLQELETLLNNQHCNFEILAHPSPILSTQDAAKYFDIEKSVPTLILLSEHGLLAFIASSQRGRVDLSALKQQLGYLTLKMADKKAVQNHTGYQPGSIPLIDHGLPCLIDRRLVDYDYIYGGSGDAFHTLKIAPTDLIRMNHVLSVVD